MKLLISPNSLTLWHDVVKEAENQCSVTLKEELESYLISLLIRYTNRPDIAQQVVATAYLEAISSHKNQRNILQDVGDQCLIFAGLFPHVANKRLVKISYFVDLGQGAYATISRFKNDLYGLLAVQFVALMDVLQSIRPGNDLLPLEAFEQWHDLGSQRALKVLRQYAEGIPIKNLK